MNEQYKRCLEEMEKTKKYDMGPKWNPEELDIFIKYFKETKLEQLEEMQKDLLENNFQRSIPNIISVYVKNKNFLTYNKQADGLQLFAILEDYYDSLPAIQPEIQATPIKQVFMEPPAQINKNESVISQSYNQQQDVKSFDEQYNLFSSTKKKKQKHKNSMEIQKDTQKQETKKSGSVFKDKSKYKQDKGVFFKDIPNNSNQRVQHLMNQVKSCNGKPLKKQNKGNLEGVSQSYVRWIENEYFYCHIDKPYFEYNEFQYMLDQIGLKDIKTLTRKEWYLVRKAMGKPRRFSQKFLDQERKKLNKYRQVVRAYLNEPQTFQIEQVLKNDFIVSEVKKLAPFQVGQIVMGVHPVCGHFHQGSILTTNMSNIFVKFFTNELGVHKISDSRLSLQTINPVQEYEQGKPQLEIQNNNNTNNLQSNKGSDVKKEPTQQQQFQPKQTDSKQQNEQNGIIQDLDINSMAFLIKLLDRKTNLINQLREFNDKAENQQENLPESFYQEYGFMGVQINLIDDALRHVITKFRLRGLNHYSDTNRISGNIQKILQTPLSYIENQIEGSQDQQKTLQTIKQIQNKHKEEKIVQQIGDIVQKVEYEIYDEIQQQKEIFDQNNNNKIEEEQEIKRDQNNYKTPQKQNGEQQQQQQQDTNQNSDQQNNNNNENIENDDKIEIEEEQNNQNNHNNSMENNNLNTQDNGLWQNNNNINNEIEEEKSQQQNNNNIDIEDNEQNNNKENIDNGDVKSNQQQQQQNIIMEQKKDKIIEILKKLKPDQGDSETQELKNLVQNCMGVLMSLQNQSSNFDLSQSKFMQDLSSNIFQDHQEQFFELSNTILNITTKNK